MVTTSLKLKDPLVKEYIESKVCEDAYFVLKSLERIGKTDEKLLKALKRKKKKERKSDEEEVELKVNKVRSYLNQLHYLGIIYYTKEKAKESNWYTYTWFVKKERIEELLKEKYVEELEELKNSLTFEQNYTFFKCTNGCEKLPFELAFEYDFKCPECSKTMKSISNDKEKNKINNKIKNIEKFLN